MYIINKATHCVVFCKFWKKFLTRLHFTQNCCHVQQISQIIHVTKETQHFSIFWTHPSKFEPVKHSLTELNSNFWLSNTFRAQNSFVQTLIVYMVTSVRSLHIKRVIMIIHPFCNNPTEKQTLVLVNYANFPEYTHRSKRILIIFSVLHNYIIQFRVGFIAVANCA